MKNFISRVATLLFMLSPVMPVIAAAQATQANLSNKDQVEKCNFTKTGRWWEASFSSLPANVANNPVTGDPEFCEFYQFSQDYFLFMLSENSSGVSNFLDQSQFPILETSGANSCDSAYPKNSFNVRSVKAMHDGTPFVIPERINQAGRDQHAIYDQNGNIVFYEIRFTKNLCDYPAILKNSNFPGKTVELKMAWKILGANDKAGNFYTMNAKINNITYNLGLVGLHMVVTADNHPEMVWTTIEQKDNTIACKDMGSGQTARSFISKACASKTAPCNQLNKTIDMTDITLPKGTKPGDICEQFPYGTLEGQPITTVSGLNIALLEKLNANMQTILAANGVPSDLKVWKNYKIKGALWVSDITKDSGPATGSTNQRGSLELANTVMETSFQGNYNQAGSSVNCFACHQYFGTASGHSNTQTSATSQFGGISHIFDDIISGQNCKDFSSGTLIYNQSQANSTCPSVCQQQTRAWNGQWTNLGVSQTVCGCCVP